MGVTAFSFVLLPLSLLWIMQPMRLLQLLTVAAVFEAAAAFTVGNLGVQPGLVPALAFLGYVSLQLLLGAHYPGQHQVWRLCLPFLLVTAWAVISSYLMPRLFEGQVYVWPQKALPPFVLTILAPSPSNMNQDFYLLIDAAVLLLVALFLTSARLSQKSLLNAYFLSGFLAAGVGIWQLGNRVAGVPFPDALFYSNPGWAILTEQNIGAVPRINGSFSEPSSLGSYMAAAVCSTGWMMLQGHRDNVIRLLFVVGLFGVVLSTSTTGFAVLTVAGVGILAYALVSGSARIMASVIKIGLPLVLLLGLTALAASALAPSLITNVEQVFTATANKKESSSYQDRTSADLDSLTAMVDTYGLGTGWGSNRSSSLIPGLLAAVGIPGVLGLGWFAVGLFRQVRRVRRTGCTADQRMVIDGTCGALTGFLIGGVISAPTISSVTFFFLLALLIGCVARADVDSHTRRAGRRRTPVAPLRAGAAVPVGHNGFDTRLR